MSLRIEGLATERPLVATGVDELGGGPPDAPSLKPPEEDIGGPVDLGVVIPKSNVAVDLESVAAPVSSVGTFPGA